LIADENSALQRQEQALLSYRMRMTSFTILYAQCCRRHLVGQRFVNEISVIRSCWSSLCSDCYYAHCRTWNVYFTSHKL